MFYNASAPSQFGCTLTIEKVDTLRVSNARIYLRAEEHSNTSNNPVTG